MKKARPSFLYLLVLLCGSAGADSDGERAALARLVHEIEAIAPLIREAEMQADPTARVRFQYGWLQQDLDRVKLGIREHLDAPRAEPRTFPPLQGDYRR